MTVVFGECGREITPGNTGSGRERGGGVARTEQLREVFSQTQRQHPAIPPRVGRGGGEGGGRARIAS